MARKIIPVRLDDDIIRALRVRVSKGTETDMSKEIRKALRKGLF